MKQNDSAIANKFSAFVGKFKMESPIHISKRMDMPKWKALLIKAGAVVLAFFVCAIITVAEGGNFGGFFVEMGKGNFMQLRNFINLLQEMAILLIIALAVTPAFKMKFWNIGAEGQVLMGGLMCATCMFYIKGSVPNEALIIIMLLASVAGGAIWGVIPAIFKAKWNTNETLFTLMMNYIAIGLVAYTIMIWVPSGSAVLGVLRYGQFPRVNNQPYVINIIVVAIVTVFMYIYLRFSKHGYELSVVGESVNTAKYIGISVPKVIIRTMLLSGAICGIAGWLLVGGTSFSITTETAGGRGFTAILVSWLGQFNPIYMAVIAFLVAFLKKGAAQLSMTYGLGGSYPDIITGVFFFIVIASEFFVNYRVKFNFRKAKSEAVVSDEIAQSEQLEEPSGVQTEEQTEVDEEVTK